jgi:hypothetical protein
MTEVLSHLATLALGFCLGAGCILTLGRGRPPSPRPHRGTGRPSWPITRDEDEPVEHGPFPGSLALTFPPHPRRPERPAAFEALRPNLAGFRTERGEDSR